MKENELKKNLSEMSVMDLLKYCEKEIETLRIGKKFGVRDLFKGHQWNDLTKGTRLKLGIMFLEFANSGEGKRYIEFVEKTSSSQNEFKRIKPEPVPQNDEFEDF